MWDSKCPSCGAGIGFRTKINTLNYFNLKKHNITCDKCGCIFHNVYMYTPKEAKLFIEIIWPVVIILTPIILTYFRVPYNVRLGVLIALIAPAFYFVPKIRKSVGIKDK